MSGDAVCQFMGKYISNHVAVTKFNVFTPTNVARIVPVVADMDHNLDITIIGP